MEVKKASKFDLENRKALHFGIGMVISISLTITAFEWRSEVEPVVILEKYECSFSFPEGHFSTKVKHELEPPPSIWKDNGSVITNDLRYKTSPINYLKDSVFTTNCGFPAVKGFPHYDSNEIYTIVEEMPSYEGGFDKLSKEIEMSINFPKEAKQMNVEGRVFVEFIVQTDGSLQELRVIKGVGTGCDEEALRVMSLIPNFVPGKQRGVRVPVKMVIPINFKLQ